MALGGAAAVTVLGGWVWRRRSERVVGAAAATWISTTQSSPWQMRPLRSNDDGGDAVVLEVHPESAAQTIEGFGACFNELGWISLQALSSQDHESVFRELFSPGVGANLNLCRMPVGANDFSRGWYSYDETPGDFALEHFSIANDLETLIPFIRGAQRYNPKLRLWASPWSPPSWMKRNGFYAETPSGPGQPPNGITPEQVGKRGSDMFLQEDAYFEVYARYFARFIDAYRKEGIGIGMVMPQNEFNSAQAFPSCTWTPAGLARFIQHLGPEMRERGVAVFLGTLELEDAAPLETVLAEPNARKFVSGVGVQWAGKGALSAIHKKRPDLTIYQSEQECGDGKNDWHHCLHCWELMKFYLRRGTSGYLYWNISLEQGGESRWGWRQNSLITVDTSAQSYRFNHEYYLLKHVSHFVQAGAKLLRSGGLGVDALAFGNPDSSIAVVLRNDAGFGRPIDVSVDGRRVEGWMEADSFNTLLLKPED